METPQARRSNGRLQVNARDLGEGALDFARWFARSKFDLMAGFFGELKRDPATRDAADVERRFLEAVRHAKRVLVARGIVTFLLALGVITTAGTAIVRFLVVPTPLRGDVQTTLWALDRFAAVAASASVLLVGARLLFDRYLDMVETSATFLAMQLASCEA